MDEADVVPFPQMDDRQIVAFGGGGFSMEAGNPLLDDYVLDLARARRERPRVCNSSGNQGQQLWRQVHLPISGHDIPRLRKVS